MSVFDSIQNAELMPHRTIGSINYVYDKDDNAWHAIFDNRHWFSIHNAGASVILDRLEQDLSK